MRRLLSALAAIVLVGPALPSVAADNGLVTRPSTHTARETVTRFAAAVREAGWVVFTEIDHAAAANAVGMQLQPRTVVLFGNPSTGTPPMRAAPTLAIDLPMRVLIWQDDAGRAFVTRSTGRDIGERVFARHGLDLPADAQRNFDSVIAGLVRKAAE